MASVRPNKRASGRTTYTVYYRDQRRRSREKTFDRKTDASQFKAKVEHERYRGVLVDTTGARRAFIELMKEYVNATQVRWTTNTRVRNESLIRNHIEPTLGGLAVGSVTHADIQGLIASVSQSHAPDTTRKVYNLVRGAFDWAIDRSLVASSPCRRIALPPHSHNEKRFLNSEEVKALADAIDPRFRAMVFVGAMTGLRPGELRALRMERVDLMHRRLTVAESLVEVQGRLVSRPPKGRSHRVIELPTEAVRSLESHLGQYGPGHGGLVFSSAAGGAIRPSNFRRRVWGPAVERSVGAPCRIHDLRHTHVALLIEARVDSLVIRDRLGHQSITITLDHYGHLFGGRDREAADLIDAAFEHPGVGILLG